MRRYLRASSAEQLIASGALPGKLDRFKPYQHQRLADGVDSVAVLYAEVTARGYTGSYRTVARPTHQTGNRPGPAAIAGLVRRRPPPVRQVAAWIVGLPGNLDPEDEARMKVIRVRCPEIDTAVGHVARFAHKIEDLSGGKDRLTAWMTAVDHDLPQLRPFTRGLRRDIDAVTDGLTLPYSSGPVEGAVRRAQVVKTTRYGRANPDLLRTLILQR